MARMRGGASLLGMSARVVVPALLGLALLVVTGGAAVVRFVTRPPAPPLSAQLMRLPMDGSCYVVSATGFDLVAPPPAPPAPGSPVGAIDAWSTAARATPVGTSRTRLTVVAVGEPVKVTGVDVSGTTSEPRLIRDWALMPGCRRGLVLPAGASGASGVPTVLLRGDLDGVTGGRSLTLATQTGASALPLTLRAGDRAHLLLDLSVRTVSVRWTATVHWTAGGRSGTTVLDTQAYALNLLSDARVGAHYGWDAGRARWVDLGAGAS